MAARSDDALLLHKSGRLAEAEAAYSDALADRPDDPDLRHGFGVLLAQRGELAKAMDLIRSAIEIRPAAAAYHNSLGNLLQQEHRLPEAEREFRNAVSLQPGFAIAHFNLGNALRLMGRIEDALSAYRNALSLRPEHAETNLQIGIALLEGGRAGEALPWLERASLQEPGLAAARAAYADALDRSGDQAKASEQYRALVSLQPTRVEAWCNLGRSLIAQGRYAEAVTAFEEGIRRSPELAELHYNLGVALLESRNLPESEAAFRQALAIAPHDQRASFGAAAALLARGDFERGWRMFEERQNGCLGNPSRFGDLPQWDGGQLEGALLVVCEQGLGDVVQFARFVPDARRRVRRLSFLADGNWRTLAPLLATLQGIDDLCTDETALASLPERPVARASVLSLPYLLGLRVEALPGTLPYVSPLAERTALWKPRLEAIPHPRVGLAWAVLRRGEMSFVTRQKTIPLALLAPVLAAPRANFVSLQLGRAEELASTDRCAERMIDLTSDIQDFGDTAAIIAELDLVISSDTSVAHVAGAMGKSVWMLDRYNTCWRWRLAEDRSPWYPTMRIFRQRSFGDWHEPIARVAAALEQLNG